MPPRARSVKRFGDGLAEGAPRLEVAGGATARLAWRGGVVTRGAHDVGLRARKPRPLLPVILPSLTVGRRRSRALVRGVIGGVVIFSSSRGHAQGAEKAAPRTSSLSWIRLPGADTCVSTQELARDVEARLGRAVFVSPARADVSVEGHIEPSAPLPGWNATILVRDAAGAPLGTRAIHRDDGTCDGMREPLALVIAVMIDPDAAMKDRGTEAVPPRPAPEVAVRVDGAAGDGAVTAAPAAATDETRWRFDGGPSVIGGLGLLPEPALGVYAGGLLTPPRFVPLQGFGAVWFDNSASTEGAGRATFSLMVLGGGICPLAWHTPRVAAYGCANGQLGFLESRGQGFDQPRPDEQKVYLAGALEGRLSVRVVGPLAVRGGVSAAVPLMRDSFVYRRADGAEAELFRMAPVVATGDLGLAVVMP